jgi:malate/lactate dehydrogenase
MKSEFNYRCCNNRIIMAPLIKKSDSQKENMLKQFSISMPAILGRKGTLQTLSVSFTKEEQNQFEQTCIAVQSQQNKINCILK